MKYVVAPRAYWKGYLKLSLVSCPVALFPASSEREKISFNQINKKTGNRIRYRKVDAETGDEVDSSDIIKGYEVGKGAAKASPGRSEEKIRSATATAHEGMRTRRRKGFADGEAGSLTAVLDARAKTSSVLLRPNPKGTHASQWHTLFQKDCGSPATLHRSPWQPIRGLR
jgi:hypothetical protein